MSKLADFASNLLGWYDKEKRDMPWRSQKDPYRILVSEVMLQQTRVQAAADHYVRFIDELPDVYALANCSDDRLFKLWDGLGYYRRARNLRLAAKQIVERYGGTLPLDVTDLLSLSGVGEYTAGAVGSIAFDLPVAAVDGNVLRVISRLLADDRETM